MPTESTTTTPVGGVRHDGGRRLRRGVRPCPASSCTPCRIARFSKTHVVLLATTAVGATTGTRLPGTTTTTAAFLIPPMRSPMRLASSANGGTTSARTGSRGVQPLAMVAPEDLEDMYRRAMEEDGEWYREFAVRYGAPIPPEDDAGGGDDGGDGNAGDDNSSPSPAGAGIDDAARLERDQGNGTGSSDDGTDLGVDAAEGVQADQLPPREGEYELGKDSSSPDAKATVGDEDAAGSGTEEGDDGAAIDQKPPTGGQSLLDERRDDGDGGDGGNPERGRTMTKTPPMEQGAARLDDGRGEGGGGRGAPPRTGDAAPPPARGLFDARDVGSTAARRVGGGIPRDRSDDGWDREGWAGSDATSSGRGGPTTDVRTPPPRPRSGRRDDIRGDVGRVGSPRGVPRRDRRDGATAPVVAPSGRRRSGPPPPPPRRRSGPPPDLVDRRGGYYDYDYDDVEDDEDEDDDEEDLPGTRFWMGIDSFRRYLKQEALLRASLVPDSPRFRQLLKREGRVRYDLYRGWLRLLKYGIGDGDGLVPMVGTGVDRTSFSDLERSGAFDGLEDDAAVRGKRRGRRRRPPPDARPPRRRRAGTSLPSPPPVADGAGRGSRRRRVGDFGDDRDDDGRGRDRRGPGDYGDAMVTSGRGRRGARRGPTDDDDDVGFRDDGRRSPSEVEDVRRRRRGSTSRERKMERRSD